MTQIVSSISGIEIWAPSAGSASMAITDKNGRDITKCVESSTVSAIASGYQVVSSTGSATYYSGGNQTGISGINGSAILAASSKTASYAANAGYANTCDTANVAMYDSNGRMLSSIGTSTVTLASPLGTIDVAGYDLEGTDSAALPGTAMQSGLYASQAVYYDDPYMGTVVFAPHKYKAALFFSSDSYEGITINTTGYRSPDDYENSATTSIPYGSNTAWVEWTASAVEAIGLWVSAVNNANLNIFSAIEGKDVVKLAHESAVIPWSALSGDGTSITGISGSAIGGGGVDSATVSAIASAYQVVSATATQLYAGTSYLTSVNEAPISASRAGNAANASMANSAYYDGTGRLISALPDSAAVSSIASSYAESAASGKQDSSGMSAYAYESSNSAKLDATAFSTVSSTFLTSQTVTALADDGTYITSINGSALSGVGGGGVITATGSGKVSGTGISSLNGSSIIAQSLWNDGRIMIGSGDPGMYLTGTHGTAYYKANEMIINRSGYGEQVKFNLGSAGSQVYGSAAGTRGAFIQMNNDYHSAFLGALSGKDGILELDGYSANSASMSAWDSTYNTVSSNSASWGAGVSESTVSSIASSYAESAVSSVSGNYAQSADVSATVDLVSTQSANWGGSALELSAGPGVKLEKSGSVLVASTDETVLWSGSAALTTAGQTIHLSEPCTNFDRIRIYGENWVGWTPTLWGEVSGSGPQFSLVCSYLGAAGDAVRFCQSMWTVSGTDYNISACKVFSLQGATASTSTPVNTWVRLVVGVNRTANN